MGKNEIPQDNKNSKKSIWIRIKEKSKSVFEARSDKSDRKKHKKHILKRKRHLKKHTASKMDPKVTIALLKKNPFILIGLFSIILAMVAIGFGVHTLYQKEKEEQQIILEEQIQQSEEEKAEKEALEEEQRIKDAAKERIAVAEGLQDAWDALLPVEMDLPTEKVNTFATIESCLISTEDTTKIELTGTMPGIPKSDDRKLYVFGLATYATEIAADQEPIMNIKKDDDKFSFSFDLNYNKGDARLFEKFIVAVRKDGGYIPISRGHYITNPEAIADYTYSYPTASSIKGLLVNPSKIATSELEDLGVKQAAYNIPIGNLLGPTTNGIYPTISYTYNNKTYTLNGQVVAEYDNIFGSLSKKGIQITAILLNNWKDGYLDLIHPSARTAGVAPYYMFNAADDAGVEYLAAISTFLAERYSGDSHGKVVNWVVANEINAREQWNYMSYTDVNTYTEAYARGFRVIYTGIKSINQCARVYMPIDQTWNRNLSSTDIYDGKDVLDAFNDMITTGGNIDWGLSQHPYPVPLTWAAFWAMPSKYTRMGLITNSAGSPMVSMQNINVITDYLQTSQFLTSSGEVRSVLLSELGYTSTSGGEVVQAAAFAYAYYIAENNQFIDGMLLSRETDAAEEIAQGLSFGLCNVDGTPKVIYNVYKNIDTSASAQATEFAKSIIGISSWDEVITKR